MPNSQTTKKVRTCTLVCSTQVSPVARPKRATKVNAMKLLKGRAWQHVGKQMCLAAFVGSVGYTTFGM